MSDHPDSPQAPSVPAGPSSAVDSGLPEDGGAPAALDDHGFDPADYKWIPVRRRRRVDGFSEARQRKFIEALADTGTVEQAAKEVGMSIQSCYRLRRAPGAERFAAAWDAAIEQASRKLVDLAFERAIHGSDEPVFDREGNRVGRRMRHNDRLMMFLLRAYMPDRFRHAHQDVRHPSEPAPRPAAPLAEAIAMLEPAEPPQPHLLMSPDDLANELLCADILNNGELPHWHRDPVEAPCPDAPLGDAFERQLEDAKESARRRKM